MTSGPLFVHRLDRLQGSLDRFIEELAESGVFKISRGRGEPRGESEVEVDEPVWVRIWLGDRRPPSWQLRLLGNSGAPIVKVVKRDPQILAEAISEPGRMNDLGGNRGA